MLDVTQPTTNYNSNGDSNKILDLDVTQPTTNYNSNGDSNKILDVGCYSTYNQL